MTSTTREGEMMREIIEGAVELLRDAEIGLQAQQLAARRPECLRALGQATVELVIAEGNGEIRSVHAAHVRARTAAAALRFVSDLERKAVLLAGRGGERG